VTPEQERGRLARGEPPEWACEWGEDEFGVYAGFCVGEVVQRMRWIERGEFWMGSPEDEEGRRGNEGPRFRARMSAGFWLADSPCTQALWVAVMGESPSGIQGESWTQRPVTRVSWEGTQRFIVALGAAVPGLEVGLPTEAQWEYACRAGSKEARYGPLDEVAWWARNREGKTHAVKQLRANRWGLYDMLGNVDEWCADVWERHYQEVAGEEPLCDRVVVGPGRGRAVRGGRWFGVARSVRAAYRYGYSPGNRSGSLGFRLERASGQARSGVGAGDPPRAGRRPPKT